MTLGDCVCAKHPQEQRCHRRGRQRERSDHNSRDDPAPSEHEKEQEDERKGEDRAATLTQDVEARENTDNPERACPKGPAEPLLEDDAEQCPEREREDRRRRVRIPGRRGEAAAEQGRAVGVGGAVRRDRHDPTPDERDPGAVRGDEKRGRPGREPADGGTREHHGVEQRQVGSLPRDAANVGPHRREVREYDVPEQHEHEHEADSGRRTYPDVHHHDREAETCERCRVPRLRLETAVAREHRDPHREDEKRWDRPRERAAILRRRLRREGFRGLLEEADVRRSAH